MAIPSSILPWRIPWTGELGEYRARGLKESDTTEQLSTTHRNYQPLNSFPTLKFYDFKVTR